MPDKRHIADLATILKKHQVRHIVICPGSRNAPLMQVFTRDPLLTCHSIVDERSAAYIALGMAKQSGHPVAVVTTSGTAVLNLGPAVAEAFQQEVPLILLTADRPIEEPSQFSNQVISQDNVFGRNCKASLAFPLDDEHGDVSAKTLLEADRLLTLGTGCKKGPVHINIPLQEPLYEKIPEAKKKANSLEHYPGQLDAGLKNDDSGGIDSETVNRIAKSFRAGNKILLIAGAGDPDTELCNVLEELSDKFRVTVFTENISNLYSELFITQADIVLAAAGEKTGDLAPDMVITIRGQVVSRKVRLFVQGLQNIDLIEWEGNPLELFKEILKDPASVSGNDYLNEWKQRESKALSVSGEYMRNAPFSNLKAVKQVLESIPDNAVLHLGNSGTIRYSQLFRSREGLVYQSNRGTSGIDGSLSTAAGAAMVSDDLHVALLGDLSFVYDSNALWNKDFPSNLRVIVLNDKGGGIFRLLEGPSRMPFYEEYSVTSHPVSLEHLGKAYGVDYLKAEDALSLKNSLDQLFKAASGLQLLEIETAARENSYIFKSFYKSLQED